MNAINIRPVTDLRNKYPDVECDVQKGPVFFTKNGYGASVLVSLEYFQSHLSRQDLYDRIARAEAEIDAGKGMDARESLRRTRHYTSSQSLTILKERCDARRNVNT